MAPTPTATATTRWRRCRTKGGNFCCLGNYAEGSFDQRSVEARSDVLVFTSDPLTEPLDLAGPIKVTLYVSSDARDTDFTVKVLDVYPDGRAFNLDDTILRARYREGFDKQVFMQEGEVYEIEFAPMANRQRLWHRPPASTRGLEQQLPALTTAISTPAGRNYDE